MRVAFSGYANSTLFENCSSSMSIVSKGCSGGIVGTSDSGCSFNSCTFNGANISGTEYVGGIVGKQYDSSDNISLCSVNSTITGTNYVGGLVGGGGSLIQQVLRNVKLMPILLAIIILVVS